MRTSPTVAPALAGVLIASIGLALSLFPGAAHARIKCWTNNEGVRECGNTVPPEYAKKSHDEISSQGVKLRSTARAKTEEELRKEKEERARKEEQERQRRVRAKHDRVLLATFTTEEDMVLTRDGQLASIDGRIKNTERAVAKLEKRRDDLRAEAAKQELGGKAVSDEVRSGLAAVGKRIQEQHHNIDKLHRERGQILDTFEVDLARYRQLKAGKPVGSP